MKLFGNILQIVGLVTVMVLAWLTYSRDYTNGYLMGLAGAMILSGLVLSGRLRRNSEKSA